MAKQAKRQLKGKVVIKLIIRLIIKLTARLIVKITVRVITKLAAAIGEKIIKWDKKALNALFNKTIKYSIINNYVFTINELYI